MHALLLNGGGRRQTNYSSHLSHLRRLVELLTDGGVPAANITIFSGDGVDPGADLARFDPAQRGDFGLLPEHGVGKLLRARIEYVDSRIEGFELRPAVKASLREWFLHEGKALHNGDTLLLYVTDHGKRNPDDALGNTIVLWGEELSVGELRELLALLRPGVRVVFLMSQCFSGAFASLIFPPQAEGLPAGNVCGYFASTADRPAYGCYAENRGREGVGHSFRFFEALSQRGGFRAAQELVLVTDRTPDVPHKSTDFFFDRLLGRAAAEAGQDPEALTDELLSQAWRNRAAWEPELRLLDRIGHSFGFFSPRSLAEMDTQSSVLPQFSDEMHSYANRWREALEALKAAQFASFVEQYPSWRERLKPRALRGMDGDERGRLGRDLLGKFSAFMHRDPSLVRRLTTLDQRVDDAGGAAYRSEIRLAAVLRMRWVLTDVAGRTYLAKRGSSEERAAFAKLAACEDLRLDMPGVAHSVPPLPTPQPFPPMRDEQRLVESVRPAWMGILYHPLSSEQRERLGLARGAAVVTRVFPDSAAELAGFHKADVLLGPPDHLFTEPHMVKEWTMRQEIGVPTPLLLLRNGEKIRVTLRPDPFPLEVPRLFGPPKVGNAAPPVDVNVVRGPKQLRRGTPRLLFFWATWCSICKSAVPELLAFEQSTGTQVVAITDEDVKVVTEFLDDRSNPFPRIVATDPYRITFQDYGVSGMPTFALIDETGVVDVYQVGYDHSKGLAIPEWSWKERSSAD